jgi:hypothetical protein
MAKQNKTITIRVRFFTTDLPKRTAWTRGSIEVQRNDRHGISHVPGGDMFNSLEELVPTILRVARNAGIKFKGKPARVPAVSRT